MENIVANATSYVAGYGVYGENNTTYTITNNGQDIYCGSTLLSCNVHNYRKEIIINEGTTTLAPVSLYSNRCKKIKFPSSINTIKGFLMYLHYIEEIYFYSITPPEFIQLSIYYFLYDSNPNVKIYVPAESVALYKSQSWMGEFADNVVAMP